MPKPQVGDTFLIQYQIVAEVENGDVYEGMMIMNPYCNKFWAVPVANPKGPKIMVFFEDDYDPFMQGLKEFNLKPLDGSPTWG